MKPLRIESKLIKNVVLLPFRAEPHKEKIMKLIRKEFKCRPKLYFDAWLLFEEGYYFDKKGDMTLIQITYPTEK